MQTIIETKQNKDKQNINRFGTLRKQQPQKFKDHEKSSQTEFNSSIGANEQLLTENYKDKKMAIRRDSMDTIGSRNLLPQIKIRGVNQDLRDQLPLISPTSKRFKSIEPQQKRIGFQIPNAKHIDGANTFQMTDQENSFLHTFRDKKMQQMWNYDSELLYDAQGNRVRKQAYIDMQHKKLKDRIQRQQQSLLEKNQIVENQQQNRMGVTFQDRARVEKQIKIKNQLIQNAKFMKSPFQTDSPTKIQEQDSVSSDGNIKNNLGNVTNIIAKNLKNIQENVKASEASIMIDQIGERNATQSRHDYDTATEGIQDSFVESTITKPGGKIRNKQMALTQTHMNVTENIPKQLSKKRSGFGTTKGQQPIKIQDDTTKSKVSFKKSQISAKKSQVSAKKSKVLSIDKQSSSMATANQGNRAKATATKFRDRKLKQYLNDMMVAAESKTPTYKEIVEKDFDKMSLKLRKKVRNVDREIRAMSQMSRSSPRKMASASGSPVRSSRSPEKQQEMLRTTFQSQRTSVASATIAFATDARRLKQNMDQLEKQSYLFHKMHPEFQTGMTPIDQDVKSFQFQRNKYRSIHNKMKQADPPQVLTNQEIKHINERQRRYKELMALSESSHFERSMLDQSNRPDSEMPADFVYKMHSNSNLLMSYRKDPEPKRIRVNKDPLFKDIASNEEEYIIVPPSPIRVFASHPKPKPEDQVSTPSVTSHVKQTLEESRAVRQSKKKDHEAHKDKALNRFFDYVQMEQIFDNVVNLNRELDPKLLDQKFKQHDTLTHDQSLQLFSKHIQEQKEFREMCKYGKSPKIIEIKDNDPSYQYFKITDQKHLPAINIFNKIVNNGLHLIGYNLNEALCEAFEASCKLQPNCITEIMLDNNGLRDQGMAMVLRGLNGLSVVKKIVIKNQMDFGKNSIEQLQQLTLRKPSKNVEELRLTNLRLTAKQSQTILQNLLEKQVRVETDGDFNGVDNNITPLTFQTVKVDCFLQKLSLVKCNIDSTVMPYLLQLMNESRLLSELDISFNDFLAKDIHQISEVLASNRQLKYLNLSWNEAVSYSKKSKTDVPNFEGNILQTDQMTEMESQITQNLCKFIKYNQYLLHLDLSQMSLHSEMIKELGPALRKAKSLLSLHLSGNPGATKDVKTYLRWRVRCVPKYKSNHIDGIDRETLRFGNQENSPLKLNQTKEGAFKAGQQLKIFAKEMLQQDDGRLQFESNSGNHLVFQRVLGHKNDIPGSGQWTMLENVAEKCWVCHHHVYSLILWSEDIGKKSSENALSAVFSDEVIIAKVRDLHRKVMSYRMCLQKEATLTEGEVSQVQLEIQEKTDALEALRPQDQLKEDLQEFTAKIQKEQKALNGFSDKAEKARKSGNDAKVQEMEAEQEKVSKRIEKIKEDAKDLIEENKKRKNMLKEIDDLQKELDVFSKKFQKLDEKMNNWSHSSQYDTVIGEEGGSPGIPVIQGPFTNWHPKQMMPIEKFCQQIDTQVDVLEKMRRENLCRQTVMAVHELNEEEMKVYEQMSAEYHELYENTWLDILKDEIEEKNINLVNFDYIKHLYEKNVKQQSRSETSDYQSSDSISESVKPINKPKQQKLYVFPCVLKPGPLTYMVRLDPLRTHQGAQGIKNALKIGGSLLLSHQSNSMEDSRSAAFSIMSQDPEFFVHNFIVPFRTEEIPNYVKSFNTVQTVRNFDKNNSVFREWREETIEKLEQSTQHDMNNWKGEKFIKSGLDEVKDIIRRYMVLFKQIHTYYAGSSMHFPYMGNLEFWSLIDKLNLTSKKQFIQPSLTAATQIDKQHPNFNVTVKDGLLRFQLIEVLVRIADVLHRDSFPTMSERLEYFIEEQLLPVSQPIIEEWSDFRNNQLWTKEVNKVLEINRQSILDLMRQNFLSAKFQYLSQEKAVLILTSEGMLTERDAKHVYAMSKMPCTHETREIQNMQKVQNSAEFMEMIGRAANLKYNNDSSLRLAEKIEKFLQPLLSLIGAPVISPHGVADINEQSQSDEDY